MHFYSMHIYNFRTLRHGSCTDCQLRFLAAFHFFPVFFCVTFMPAPRVLSLWTYVCFANNIIFLANQQVAFLRLNKFEKNF